MASAVRYGLIGAAVGIIFPITGLIIRLVGRQSLSDPLFLLVCAVPFVTATWAYLFGQRSEKAKHKLEQQVKDFQIAATALDATLKQNKQIQTDVKRAHEEVDRMARVAAHDLAAPLVGMKRLAEWIREEISDDPPGDSMQHVLTLEQRIDRMTSLVSRIERFASAGRMDVPNALVHAEGLVRDIFATLPGHRRFQLHTELLPPLDTAKKKLRTVFTLLMNNAMRHHDLAEGNLTISAHLRRDLVEFTVRDDGPGIPKEYCDKVFDLFVTLERRDVKEAAGAGLAIAKKIVQSEGGDIKIVPHEGRGTTVVFSWPRKRSMRASGELDTEMRDSIEFVVKKRQTLSGME